MGQIRKIRTVLTSKPTIEGAGVRLKRVFGFNEVPQFDPFLLMDDFHSSNPDDYLAGFPWHPHRGIETITYMLKGEVEHQDSLGHVGIIQPGDVQWMTAGSGIIHQEMPRESKPELWGFQLWANLPASHKMMAPRYRDVKEGDIPELRPSDKVRIRIICGEVDGLKGPVQEIVTDPEVLDITVGPETVFKPLVKEGYTVFIYVMEGSASFDSEGSRQFNPETVVLFDEGDLLHIATAKEGLRFLLVSGKPLNEPVAWAGPIVMNSQEELKTAFEEYQNGTFIKHPK